MPLDQYVAAMRPEEGMALDLVDNRSVEASKSTHHSPGYSG
jgi:hypothetical protein